jgi:hypothetical protein
VRDATRVIVVDPLDADSLHHLETLHDLTVEVGPNPPRFRELLRDADVVDLLDQVTNTLIAQTVERLRFDHRVG